MALKTSGPVQSQTSFTIHLAQLKGRPGDFAFNFQKLSQVYEKVEADLIVTPELFLSGYGIKDAYTHTADLKVQIERVESQLCAMSKRFPDKGLLVGSPEYHPGPGKPFYNAAALFLDGKVQGRIRKSLLANETHFEDARYFEPGDSAQHKLEFKGYQLGVLICEDAWASEARQDSAVSQHQDDPVAYLTDCDAVLVMASSPYRHPIWERRLAVHQQVVNRVKCPLLWVNEVQNYDNVVVDGRSFVLLPDHGGLVWVGKFFEEDAFLYSISAEPKRVQKGLIYEEPCQEERAHRAISFGIRHFFAYSGLRRAVIGISGGIDSALSACLAVDALGAENVFFYFLPARFTSTLSQELASKLVEINGWSHYKEINIEEAFLAMEKLAPFHGIAHENLQARLRNLLLLGFSNESKVPTGLIVNTNRSELEMGYYTYGDHLGSLDPVMDLDKTEVYRLARWINEQPHLPSIPVGIIDRPPTAELRKDQVDQEDLTVDYELRDQIFYDFFENRLSIDALAKRYTMERPELAKEDLCWVYRLIRKHCLQEFKRRTNCVGISLRNHTLDMNAWRYTIVSQMYKNLPTEESVAELLRL